MDDLRGAAAVLPALGWLLACPGTGPAQWTGALVLLAVGTAVCAVRGAPVRPGGHGTWALRLLAGWTLLSAVSIVWAQDPGRAWEAAGRAALVTLTAAVLLRWPPSRRVRAAAPLAWVAVAGLLAAAGWWHATTGGQLPDGRLAHPFSYANAVAAVAVSAAAVAVGLSGTGRRGPWTAATVLLLATATLTQSRAVIPLAAVALVAGVLTAERRAVAFGCALLAAAATVAVAPFALAVRTAALGAASPAPAAREALLAALAAALVAGAMAGSRRVAGLAGHLHRPRPRARVRVALAAAALALVAAFAVGASSGGPASYAEVEAAPIRLTAGLHSSRPDYWRVAAVLVREQPLTGVGAGSFQAPYLRLRRASTVPVHAHGLPAEAGATLGLPGLVLLGGGLLALVLGARRGPGVAAAAVLLVHVQVDWVWEVPLIALAVTGLLASAHAPPRPVPRRRGRWILPAAALAAGVAVLPLGVAARLQHDAPAAGPGAVETLRLAERLDPLSARVPLTIAVLADAHGRREDARAALRRAHRRQPAAWFPLYGLAVLGPRTVEGRRALAAALAADPAEPALLRLRDGRVPADLGAALATVRATGG